MSSAEHCGLFPSHVIMGALKGRRYNRRRIRFRRIRRQMEGRGKGQIMKRKKKEKGVKSRRMKEEVV